MIENVQETNNSIIEEQKSVAKTILERLQKISPHAVLAGGAPRDWYNLIPAKDLDFFIVVEGEENVDVLASIFTSALEDLFDYDIGLTLLSDPMYNASQSHPYLHAVFDVRACGFYTQIIVCKQNICTERIHEYFPLSICQIAWDGDMSYYTAAFSNTAINKVITKTGEFHSPGYINKIFKKYPDYLYTGPLAGLIMSEYYGNEW